MKLIKSLLLGLFLGFAFLVLIAITVSFIYEKEVTQYIIEELNESIDVKINVENSKFSLLRKFPNASIEFKSVTAYSPSSFPGLINGLKTDTLFYADKLFLQFNIFDLLTHNYTIKNIHFDQGKINVFIDREGNENYRFWDSDETSDNGFKLELSKVKLTQTDILFCDEKNNIHISSRIDKANLAGLLFKENFSLEVNSLMLINDLSIEKDNYIANKNLAIDLLLNVGDEKITFTKGNFTLESFNASITGNIAWQTSLVFNLSIFADDQLFERLINVLPINIANELPKVQANAGLISLRSTITGEFSENQNPKVDGEFQLKKASISDISNRIKVKQIYTSGEFSNGTKNRLKTAFIKLNSFSAALDKSTISGSLLMSDFSDPTVHINYSADLDFSEMHTVFSIDTLEVLEGTGKIKGTFSGNINEFNNIKFFGFFKKDFAFNLQIKNGLFKIKGNPLIVREIFGLLAINETLYTDSLYFKILDNDILLSGEATNLYQYFSSQGTSSIIAELISNSIDLNQLSPLFFSDKSEKKDPSYKFPDRLNIFLNLQIQNFSVGKFNATQIIGSLNYKPKMFSLHEISFQSMDGTAKIGGVIVQDYMNDFNVKFQSFLKEIDINKLFYSFNDFGQTFLQEKNISGNISGNLYFSSIINDKLEINKKSVISESNLVIENGALLNFEPLKQLSKFIDINELEHIKFSTLQNQISIKDEKVFIPRMDINSSAINITVSGTHRFDNTFEYRFRVLLSDLLASKAKNKAEQNNENETYEDDGLGKTNIYLKISGNPDDYKISYDHKQAREARKIELQKEKTQLKKIFNDEFGWFKRDSSILKDTFPTKKPNTFKIEWEENPTNNELNTKEKEIKSDQKFQISFDEDSTSTDLF